MYIYIYMYVNIQTQVLRLFSRAFFKCLFAETALLLSSDPVANVRRRVCRCVWALLRVRRALLRIERTLLRIHRLFSGTLTLNEVLIL